MDTFALPCRYAKVSDFSDMGITCVLTKCPCITMYSGSPRNEEEARLLFDLKCPAGYEREIASAKTWTIVKLYPDWRKTKEKNLPKYLAKINRQIKAIFAGGGV